MNGQMLYEIKEEGKEDYFKSILCVRYATCSNKYL